jgi:hypothetical protein
MKSYFSPVATARFTTLFVLAGAAAFVACGNSDDDDMQTSTGDGGTAGTGGGGSCTPPADQCDLLTTTEAATALGVSSTITTMPGTMGPGDTSIDEPASGQCTWTDPTDEDVLSVVYVCGEANNAMVTAEVDAVKEEIGAGTAVAVSGVGLEAGWVLTSTAAGLEPDGGSYSGGLLTVVTNGGYVILTIAGDGTGADLQARATVAAGLVVSRL